MNFIKSRRPARDAVRIISPISAFPLLAVLVMLACMPVSLPAASPIPSSLLYEGYHDGAEFHIKREILPGVAHCFDSTSSGPLAVSATYVDLRRPDLAIEVEEAKDRLFVRETVPAMMRRMFEPNSRPVVGINADFFSYSGWPVNLFVDEGTICTAPWVGEKGELRAVFAFDDRGNLALGLPRWRAVLRDAKDSKAEIPIAAVNISDNPTSVVIAYTWPYGEKTPAPEAGQTAVTLHLLDGEEWLPNAPAAASVESVGGSNVPVALNRRTIVLMIPASTALPSWLKAGARVELAATLENLPGRIVGAVGGGPTLVHKGKVVASEALPAEKFPGGGFAGVNPRTAIGVLPDGHTLVFVVVDGRQKARSVGISIAKLGRLMRDLGCSEAINFDGGGSSSMVIFDETVNFPSDTAGPRPVTNAVIVRRTAPVGPLARLAAEPRTVCLPPGASISLRARGFDVAGEPVPLDGWAVRWALKKAPASAKNPAKVTEDGRLFVGDTDGALQVVATASPTTATLAAGAALPTAQAAFEIATPAQVAISPSVLLLSKGEEEQFEFTAKTAKGRPFLPDPTIWEVTAPPFVRYVPAERKVVAKEAGAGVMRFQLGGVTSRVKVAVDRFREAPSWGFDLLPPVTPDKWITGTRFDAAQTSLRLDPERRKEGTASWRLAYNLTPGAGTSKVSLPLDAVLPGNPLAVGVWVYGDGRTAWLRGELRAAEDHAFYLDFTDSDNGITWKGEWKQARASLLNPTPFNPKYPPPQPPLRIKSIYIIQTDDDYKGAGELWFDGLTALYLPEELEKEP